MEFDLQVDNLQGEFAFVFFREDQSAKDTKNETGIEFDNMLGETVLHHNLSSATQPAGQLQEAYGTLKDVQMLRNFLGGNAVFAFFDLPWMPIYLIFIFIFLCYYKL